MPESSFRAAEDDPEGSGAEDGPPYGLLDLLADCTVRVCNAPAKRCGTGFFVAPGEILTARHTVTIGSEPEIEVTWKGQALTITGCVDAAPGQTESGGVLDAAILHVAPPADSRPPCVLLDSDVLIGDDLYIFGYPKGAEGNPFTVRAVHFTSGHRRLKVASGQIPKGLSGAPLLNRQTRAVCALVSDTLEELSELGGFAVPARLLFNAFPGLRDRNLNFHRNGDGLWVRLAQRELAPTQNGKQRWATSLVMIASHHRTTLDDNASVSEKHHDAAPKFKAARRTLIVAVGVAGVAVLAQEYRARENIDDAFERGYREGGNTARRPQLPPTPTYTAAPRSTFVPQPSPRPLPTPTPAPTPTPTPRPSVG